MRTILAFALLFLSGAALAGGMHGSGGGGTAPPVNTVAPVASGTPVVGSLLSTTAGTWTGSPTLTYSWLRGGTPIGGATSTAYTLVTADIGAMISAAVTGVNAGGSTSAASNSLGPVTGVNVSCSTFTGFGSGAAIDDGCDQSSPLLSSSLGYQNTNLLNASGTSGSIFQSGQVLRSNFHANNSSLVNWNVAGDDFPVGIGPCVAVGAYTCPTYPSSAGSYCSTDARETTRPCSHDNIGAVVPLIDASAYSWTTDPVHTGCTSTANWPSSGGQLYAIQCAAGAATNVMGFDFGPYTGGNYECVGLYITDRGGGATGGTINFSNNRTFWSNRTSCTTLSNEISSAQMNPIYIAPEHTWTVKIWNNLFDGNAKGTYNPAGGTQAFPYGPPISYGQVTSAPPVNTINSSLSVRYNYWRNIMWRAMVISSPPCGGYEYVGNVLHNIGDQQANVHGNSTGWAIQTGPGGLYELPACPGYSNGYTSPGTNYPVPAPNGWTAPVGATTGVSWGTFQYNNNINNTMWDDSTVRGGVSELIHFEAGSSTASVLTNMPAATFSLNVMVPNLPEDAGGNQHYYVSSGAGVYVAGPGSYTPVTNDLLTAAVSVCAPGVTPYTFYPVLWLRPASDWQWADVGDCGYTNPIVWKFVGNLTAGSTTVNVTSITSPLSLQPSLPDPSTSKAGQTLFQGISTSYRHWTGVSTSLPVTIQSCSPSCTDPVHITSLTLDFAPSSAYPDSSNYVTIAGGTALSTQGNINNVHLLCKVCTGAGAPAPGTDIGWVTSSVSFTNLNVSDIVALSGMAANASSCATNPNCMAQPFENVQSLTVGPNLINQYTAGGVQTSNQGIHTYSTTQGYYLSCVNPPVLPSGSVLPPPSFFGPLGNSNSTKTGNWDSDGVRSQNPVFSTDTGC